MNTITESVPDNLLLRHIEPRETVMIEDITGIRYSIRVLLRIEALLTVSLEKILVTNCEIHK